MRLGRFLVAAAVTVFAACSGPSVAPPTASTMAATPVPTMAPQVSVEPTVEPPPSLAEACPSRSVPGANSFWVETDDGVRIYGVEAGTGTTVIILAHQARDTLCGVLPYFNTLVEAGMRVVAFDFRTRGRSDGPEDPAARLALERDLAAVVSKVRGDGADKVVLIGGSNGGAAVVQHGADLNVDAIISLSGAKFSGALGVNNPASLPRLTVPLLMIVSKRDPVVPLAEAKEVFAAVGSPEKTLLILDGDAHGYGFVDSSDSEAMRSQVLDWIEQHV